MDKNTAFDIESFKTLGDLSYSAILRFNILQIINAKASLLGNVYISMIDLLETMLMPYLDDKYDKGLKKIGEIKKQEEDKAKPKSLADEGAEIEYEAYEAKLKLLMLLMDRKNLLLEKETVGGEI